MLDSSQVLLAYCQQPRTVRSTGTGVGEYMKKLLTITMLLLALTSLPTTGVFAVSESGQAATLAFHQATDTTSDTRAERLRMFLESYDSPLATGAETFVQQADKYNLDWKLVAAIAGVESTFGKQIPTGSYNGWGWGVFTGTQSGVNFKDWAEGIAVVSEGLRKNYIDRGAQNIYDIGWIYAANGNSWATHVRYFVDKLETFAPTEVGELPVSI